MTAADSEYAGLEMTKESVEDPEKTRGKTKVKLGAKKMFVVISILVCELCERLTYYSITANMVLFCTSKLKFTSPEAVKINSIFSGVSYIVPLAGGYIADAVAGRYNTIVGAGLIYLTGLVMVPAAAIDYTDIYGLSEEGQTSDMSITARRAFFLGGLTLIAIGTGGIKANVGPFGAQQIEGLGDEAVRSFFNWFYWFINAGSLIASTGVAYIQQNVSMAWGYTVPMFSMVLALIFLVIAKKQYEYKPPGDSILAKVFDVWWKGRGGFDKVRKRNGGPHDDETVDGALGVLRVLPVFVFIIFYWTIYSQMTSTFMIQSVRMNVLAGNFKIPAAMLNTFNALTILLLIPLVDRLLYPFFKRIGHPLTHLQRIGIGLVLVGGSVVIAGVIEIYRKRDIAANGPLIQVLADQTFDASHMSVLVQIPAFALVGASEVFASITGLEFAFTQAPVSMQSVLTGLFFVTSGLGGFVNSAVLDIVQKATKSDPWFLDEINDGKAENLFFLLAGLAFLNCIGFVFVAMWYKYRPPSTSDPEDDPKLETEDKMGVENGVGVDNVGYNEDSKLEDKPVNNTEHVISDGQSVTLDNTRL